MTTEAIVFGCHGSDLLGLIHDTQAGGTRAVVIVVGGPQYRVGSHRHFLELAEELSEQGTPTLRFDYRGMGDSEGECGGFETIDDDIRAAIDALFEHRPALEEVVLFGLCDAASAVLMYAHNDERVAGIVALNPWVRSDESHARATVKHYYLQRLFSAQLWRKVLGGKFAWRESLTALGSLLAKLRPGDIAGGADLAYQKRMLLGLQAFRGHILLITSGDDMTAAEFHDWVKSSRHWQRELADSRVTKFHIAAANHTFSSRLWRSQVNTKISEWLAAW